MVEEDEFRSTYQAINERRCVFEKAILSGHCTCIHATRIYLADREGVRCASERRLERCTRLLVLLRANARFALKLTVAGDALPHTKEIQVQNGGMTGLMATLDSTPARPAEPCDITGLVDRGEAVYGALENFPFQEIMKSIVSYQGRRRRHADK